jgi:hypothetical protein
MCPDWVPGMDARQRLAPINLKTILIQSFDHRANWRVKVRNVSKVGSHKKSAFQICILCAAPIKPSNLLCLKGLKEFPSGPYFCGRPINLLRRATLRSARAARVTGSQGGSPGSWGWH